MNGWPSCITSSRAPRASTVKAANTLRFANVLVGEVWLAGGQSNMEFPLRSAFQSQDDIAQADQPMIRLIKVPHARLDEPTNDINASWEECTRKPPPIFRLLPIIFARSLQTNLHVPIGIIESDWGGTPAEAWMSYGTLRSNRDYQVESAQRLQHPDVRLSRSPGKI